MSSGVLGAALEELGPPIVSVEAETTRSGLSSNLTLTVGLDGELTKGQLSALLERIDQKAPSNVATIELFAVDAEGESVSLYGLADMVAVPYQTFFDGVSIVRGDLEKWAAGESEG